MSGPLTYQPQSPFLKWFEARLPIMGLVHSSFVVYPTPRNLNYWWTFGGILSFMLGAQIVTGVVLAMHYTPESTMAFNSVEHIMRDVNYGWLLRYLHSNGASMFFLAVYIHIFRGMYYGSYKEPREVLWILGVIIYLLMMATGFMGYVLVWGQMSLWAAKVITSLFSAIPGVGDTIVTWLWGGFAVGNPTLNRFFSLHYLLPFVIAGVVVLHVWALHVVGQNNPTGVEPKWYYLPFYAILRSIPNKLIGVIALFSSIGILFLLPWLDTSRVRSATYRPLYKQFFWIFVFVCIGLGWLGSKPPEGIYVTVARIFTAWYFIHFLVILPLLGLFETPRPLPNSISEAVLKKRGKVGAVASVVLALALGGASLLGTMSSASAAEDTCPEASKEYLPAQQKWSFAGPFGLYDRAQIQRGFKVYREVCQTCHSLSLLSFRNLGERGGLGYSDEQVKAIAADYKVNDGPNDKGEMFERPGRPADNFPSPFPNPQAAAAVYGRAPPDLSVIAKARGFERGFPNFVVDFFTQYQEAGPDYIVALLTGYESAPACFKLPPGTSYDKYFPAKSLLMPKMLTDGRVTYDDGSPQTIEQYSKDVAAFLMWAAEPHLEARKRIGFQVMIFLVVFTGLLYFTKKKVWANAH